MEAKRIALAKLHPNNGQVEGLPANPRFVKDEKFRKMTLESSPNQKRSELGGRSYYYITGGRYNFRRYVEAVGGKVLEGFQLRYIYFIDPKYRKRLTVPEVPFSEIDRLGAGMYKGDRITQAERHIRITE